MKLLNEEFVHPIYPEEGLINLKTLPTRYDNKIKFYWDEGDKDHKFLSLDDLKDFFNDPSWRDTFNDDGIYTINELIPRLKEENYGIFQLEDYYMVGDKKFPDLDEAIEYLYDEELTDEIVRVICK